MCSETRVLDESQFLRKAFLQDLSTVLEQMKAKHIEEDKAEEEAERLEEEEKQKNKELKKAGQQRRKSKRSRQERLRKHRRLINLRR
ncbi:MAG: hypothetical protein ACLS9K_10430 [Lachnospira eligens]